MPDRILSVLAIALIVLVVGHDVDHLVRGDYRFEPFADAVPLVTVTIAKYVGLGVGLLFYMKGKVGPGFWAIVAGIATLLAWLAHFSPFTEQTPQFIYGAYRLPAAGVLAVAWLAALMLALVATTLYAQYLWARASK